MKKLICLIFLFVGFACDQNQVPKEYVGLEQMSVLVEEISVLEAYYQSTYGVPGQYKEALDKAVEKTLKKHNCSLLKFKRSVYYYATHPTLQSLLNESTMTRLSRKI
jgi:hypothetical protein